MPRSPSFVRSGAMMLLSSRGLTSQGQSPAVSAEDAAGPRGSGLAETLMTSNVATPGASGGCLSASTTSPRTSSKPVTPARTSAATRSLDDARAVAQARAAAAARALDDAQVSTRHALTGRACAASRLEESQRADSLFEDPLAYKLAGREGRRNPMGSWIMVPRTRYGDDFLRRHYVKRERPCRQLVLLGAGMDARAYRMDGLEELSVYEIDQQTTFDVKEPLLVDEVIKVRHRGVVGTDFATVDGKATWGAALQSKGFDPSVPTVWLLEGLVYYLSDADVKTLMATIGSLSAPGSAVFHDSISRSYLRVGIAPMGAPFISGSDNYPALWARDAGFTSTQVRDFESIVVDRRSRCVRLSGEGRATPDYVRGRNVVLFVESEMQ